MKHTPPLGPEAIVPPPYLSLPLSTSLSLSFLYPSPLLPLPPLSSLLVLLQVFGKRTPICPEAVPPHAEGRGLQGFFSRQREKFRLVRRLPLRARYSEEVSVRRNLYAILTRGSVQLVPHVRLHTLLSQLPLPHSTARWPSPSRWSSSTARWHSPSPETSVFLPGLFEWMASIPCQKLAESRLLS